MWLIGSEGEDIGTRKVINENGKYLFTAKDFQSAEWACNAHNDYVAEQERLLDNPMIQECIDALEDLE